jgi:hypothetical protein
VEKVEVEQVKAPAQGSVLEKVVVAEQAEAPVLDMVLETAQD